MHSAPHEGFGGRLGALSHSLLSGSFWDEKLLQEVCAGLAEELQLAPDAPGGMVEFRRTLTLSFFFKFYLTVLQKLGKDGSDDVSGGVWALHGRATPLLFGDLVWVKGCCAPGRKLASLLWAFKGRGARIRDLRGDGSPLGSERQSTGLGSRDLGSCLGCVVTSCEILNGNNSVSQL